MHILGGACEQGSNYGCTCGDCGNDATSGGYSSNGGARGRHFTRKKEVSRGRGRRREASSTAGTYVTGQPGCIMGGGESGVATISGTTEISGSGI